MIRVKYNQNSSLVEGYFPKSIRYNKNKINHKRKTIDDSPYIEITANKHQANIGKNMCVINGIYQEYKIPKTELITEAKKTKSKEVEQFRKVLQFQSIAYKKLKLSTSKMARQNMLTIVSANKPSNTKYYWQDETGKTQSFTINDFKESLKKIANQDSKLYFIEAQINAEIFRNKNLANIQKLKIKERWKSHDKNYTKKH